MPKSKTITAAERRRQDLLTLEGLKAADVYAKRLGKLRERELRRVLALARDVTPEEVPDLLNREINEADYLLAWWPALWAVVGTPGARATAADLRQEKAAAEESIWARALRNYAIQRAGANIVSVTGTWKESLVALTRSIMAETLGIGIEVLTREIYKGFLATLERWQCRRIARTEALIGMADAGHIAAKTLEIPYTKQWCTSGRDNVRTSHQIVDGLVVDEDEPFELPGGWLMYPHDTSLGADASEIINCACACIRRSK